MSNQEASSRRVVIASDHAGVELKKELIHHFPQLSWEDLGPAAPDSVDYPDYADRLAQRLGETAAGTVGVLICGSGIGMSIKANRYPYLRAALCMTPELTRMARSHNDANVICLASRYVDIETAGKMLELFLSTPFEGGRHQVRVDKLSQPVADPHSVKEHPPKKE